MPDQAGQTMRELRDIKVVLQNSEGKYLAGSAIDWHFTDDRSRATAFDFVTQHVHELVLLFRNRLGFDLHPVPLPPEEVYEACDDCQCLLTPRQIFFDGRQFLCPDCKAAVEAQPRQRLAA